jgi:hypothetical protein
MPVIPALGRLRQEYCEFQNSLCYIGEILSHKPNKETKRKIIQIASNIEPSLVPAAVTLATHNHRIKYCSLLVRE